MSKYSQCGSGSEVDLLNVFYFVVTVLYSIEGGDTTELIQTLIFGSALQHQDVMVGIKGPKFSSKPCPYFRCE